MASAPDRIRVLPERLVGLAILCGIVGTVAAHTGGYSRETQQVALALGAAVGGLLMWVWYGERPTSAPAVPVGSAVVGLFVAGDLWMSAYAGVVGLGGAFVVSAVAVTSIVGLPLITSAPSSCCCSHAGVAKNGCVWSP